MSKTSILVVGASGQIGTELILKLREIYGDHAVVATDIRQPQDEALLNGPFEELNILDKHRLIEIVDKYQVNVIYQLAALLSATGEKNPGLAWDLNMNGLFHVLDLCKERPYIRLFWPSSIAVFGPTTPKDHTPQFTVCEPTTVYGISKLAGEHWCQYYHDKWNVDVRCLRYPGLIGHRSAPGGGTTDYAVHIFYEAIAKGHYECFLSADTTLPMMYMDDAIRATIEIAEIDGSRVPLRRGYNLAGFSFDPEEIAAEIRRHLPDFSMSYKPDFRQALAASWPHSIDDSEARKDWGWKPEFDLSGMVDVMMEEIAKKSGKIETE